MTKKTGVFRMACAGLGLFMGSELWAQTSAKPESSAAKDEVAAIVGGKPITLKELDAKVLKKNIKLAQTLYDARKAALDQVIIEQALNAEAAAKGVTVEQFIKDRVAEKAKPVTDADIDAFFKANAARMGGKTLEQVSPQIRIQLTNQHEKPARDELITQTKEKANVQITLEAPRVDMVVAANDPFKGGAGAKVIIAEYSDFQ